MKYYVIFILFMLGCTRNEPQAPEREMKFGIPYEIRNLSGSKSVITLVKSENTVGLLYNYQIGLIESENRIFNFDKPVRNVVIGDDRITVTWDEYSPFVNTSKENIVNAEIYTVYAVTRRNEVVKVEYTTLRDLVE